MRKIVSSCDVCDFKKETDADSMEDLGIIEFSLILGNRGAYDSGYKTKELCKDCSDKLQKEIKEFISKSKYFLDLPIEP